MNLVGRGLQVSLSARAKDASQQIKEQARSGADIFKEALRLAFAIACLVLIPTIIFFWWRASHPNEQNGSDGSVLYTANDGALAARSTLLRYFDYLGKNKWEDAYGLLSPEWQSELDPSSFRDAFLDIEDVRWAVVDQRLTPQGVAEVTVRIAFREGGKSKAFAGRFRLQQSTDGWKVHRAELASEKKS